MDADAETQRAERQQNNANAYFLRLPPEIRNTIYRRCIPKDQDVSPTDIRCQLPRIQWERRGALTQTCQAMRQDTLPIYYGLSIFALNSRGLAGRNQRILRKWVEGLSLEAVTSLWRIRVVVNTTCLLQLRAGPKDKVCRFIVVIDRGLRSDAFGIRAIQSVIKSEDVRCCVSCSSAYAKAISVVEKMKREKARGGQTICKEYLRELLAIDEYTDADLPSERRKYVYTAGGSLALSASGEWYSARRVAD